MKRLPQRKCVGCGVSKNKNELIRVVRSPESEKREESEAEAMKIDVSIDLTGKKNGRGAYICKDEGCLRKALKARRFERNLDVKISEELAGSLLNQIMEN